MMAFTFIVVIVLLLSYANGSNDNFKGVASLYGSGELTFGQARLFTSIFTLLGVLCAMIVVNGLIDKFSGKGLVSNDLIDSKRFIGSVALSTALTVYTATKIGMPISTTHGLIGSLVGAGMVDDLGLINWVVLTNLIVLPLVLSPLVAILIGWLGTAFFTVENVSKRSKNLRWLHLIAGAGVCFSRGLNDGPKIAGLLVVVQLSDINIGIAAIGMSMVIGGWIQSKKIADTMGVKMAKISANQGTVAASTTAILVAGANIFALPVSTTHVSVGAIYGVSLRTKTNENRVFIDIVKSWILTLPFALLLSAGIFYLMNTLLN